MQHEKTWGKMKKREEERKGMYRKKKRKNKFAKGYERVAVITQEVEIAIPHM